MYSKVFAMWQFAFISKVAEKNVQVSIERNLRSTAEETRIRSG